MKELKIIIPTCDKYLHLVEGLIYTINKYWDNHGEVIILGYTTPNYNLPKNMKFISMGEDRGAKLWSNDLIEFFKTFEEDYFINLIDDTLIIRPVDNNRINNLFEYMTSNESVNKIFLTGSLVEPSRSFDYGKLDLLEVKQESDYRTSVQFSIIKTSFFKKYLKPNQTPWEYELQNSKNDGLKVLTVKKDRNAPIIYSHLYRDNIGLIPEWYISKKTNLVMYEEDKQIIKKMLNFK
jgi:hypothetical protein